MRSGSIYRVSWRTAATSLGALALQLVPYALSKKLIDEHPPKPRREVNALDRPAIGNRSHTADRLSIAGTAIAVAIPTVVDWIDTGGDFATFLEDSLVLDEALAIDGLVNTLVKYFVQRPLPLVFDGDEQLRHSPRGYRAFFSGHVSAVSSLVSSMALALKLRHGARWPWLGAAALTALVAVGRVRAGKHFPSDVVVGALVGSACAVGASLLHRRRGRPRAFQRW